MENPEARRGEVTSNKDLMRAFFEGGKESVFARTMSEAIGPTRSFVKYLLNRVSGGVMLPDLNQYFAEKINTPPVVEIDKTPNILKDIDKHLINEYGLATNFINENYRKWLSLKGRIEKAASSEVRLTDYVLFGREKQYLFMTSGTMLIPIKVGDTFDEHDLENQLVNNKFIKEVVPKDGGNDLERAVSVEIAIGKFTQSSGMDPGSVVVRRMSSVTNDFGCQRHRLFEREGQIFTTLRHMGVSNLGELQQLNLALFSRGISFDKKSEKVIIDRDLADLWQQLRMISLQNETSAGKSEVRGEMEKYARERIYFEAVKTYFRENPKVIDKFLKSSEYAQFAMEFKDRNLSALGLTERGVAENMLANYYLSQFEGGVENSFSQSYLVHIPNFHKSLKMFIADNQAISPPVPRVWDKTDDQEKQLSLLVSRLKKQEYSFTKPRLSTVLKTKISEEAAYYLAKIKHQIRRNVFDRAFLSKLESKFLKMPNGTFTTVIGNVGLAKVEEEGRFTISSWLTADGYIPGGKPLERILAREQVPSESEMDRVIKDIFNGRADIGRGAYRSQEERILGSAPLILAFLQKSENVPENVGDFMRTITSADLAIRLLERFDSISENDPLIVNRFFPDGFAGFQVSAIHRYLHDFVRGVETNIILSVSKSAVEKSKRRFGGRWKNHDFSGVGDVTIEKAIGKTLEDASHRIRILNHEAGVPRKTLTDYQEFLEKIFGWDTHDMKYLRHEKFWDVWHTLGATWDCICFSRKTVFNPRVFQQW